MLLIVRVFRYRGEKQPRERELLRDGVAIDQLRRNVEIDPIVIRISIVQRTVWHVEEVIGGQTERVQC